MQMPDTSVKDFGSLREWLDLYVANNPDVDASAF